MNKGFTFVEVIITISILVIGFVAVLQVFPIAFSIEKSSQMKTQGILLAQEKMEEIISKAYEHIESEPTEDSLPSPFERFSRETKVIYVDSDLATTTSNLGLKKIKVTVSWRSSLRVEEKNVKLVILIAEK